jgi:hypothetical protein
MGISILARIRLRVKYLSIEIRSPKRKNFSTIKLIMTTNKITQSERRSSTINLRVGEVQKEAITSTVGYAKANE